MSKNKSTHTSEARISFFPLKNKESTNYSIAISIKIKDPNRRRKERISKYLHSIKNTANLEIKDHSDNFASYFIIYAQQIDPAIDLVNQVTSGIKLFHGLGQIPIKKKDLEIIAKKKLSLL